MDRDELKIGTPEAAVRSCVKLMSMLFEQPEEYVAYFLDLYYQVRCAYERESAAPAAAEGIRKEDLYPMLRELFQEALRGTPGGRSGKRLVAEVEDGPYRRCAPLPPEGEADPSTADAVPLHAGGASPSPTGKGAKTEPEKEEGDGAAVAAPPEKSRDCGEAPSVSSADSSSTGGAENGLPPGRWETVTPGTGGKRPGPWTVFKRNVVRKLETARAGGLTYAGIAAAGHGDLTEAEVMAALNAGKLPLEKWKALDAALDELDTL